MNLTPEVLLSAARYTLQNPRAGARVILSLRLTTGEALLALVLIAVISTLLTLAAASLMIARMPPEAEVQMLFANPLELALMQAIVLTFGAGMVHLIGRKFGGRGTLAGAVALIAWIEFILSLMQVVQIVALLVLPPLADVIGVMGLVVLLWLLSQLVTELHGFASVWKVFGGILGTFFTIVAAFLLVSVLVSLFGTGV
jgi:hypothetical protein